MAANLAPANDQVLLARCHDLIWGCVALEADIGIKQNTAASLQVVLDAPRGSGGTARRWSPCGTPGRGCNIWRRASWSKSA